MARPLKEVEEKRTRVAKTNLTPAEDLSVMMSAAAAGISKAEYQRRRLLSLAVTPARAKADAKLITELNDIGNNVNQLAFAWNAGREFRSDWEAIRNRLNQVLDKVLQAYEV